MNNLPPDSVDIIFTDPPYIAEKYVQAYTTLAEGGGRILKPGGFLFTYAGQYHLDDVMRILGSHLSWFWICVQRNTGAKTIVHNRKIMACFKPILIYYKPPVPKPARLIMDIHSGKYSKQYHPREQSIDETVYYLSAIARPGQVVIDPFCGSGTNCLAAHLLGLDYIGMDIDPEACKTAESRLKQQPLSLFNWGEAI